MPDKTKILIEANKLDETHMDGSRRYVLELLRGLLTIQDEWQEEFEIDIYVNGVFKGLEDVRGQLVAEEKEIGIVLPLHRRALNRFLKFLFSTAFADLMLWVKKMFPRLWGRAKSAKDERQLEMISQYALIHLTHPQTFHFFSNYRTHFVITVHDLTHLYFPEFHLPGNIEASQDGLKNAIARGASFIAVSDSTRQDMLKEYSLPAERVVRVYEACDNRKFRQVLDAARLAEVRRKYGIPERPYFLCLSTLEPRKNFVNAIKAFHQLIVERPELDLYLVVSGKKGWKYEEIFDQSLRSERVIFTGYVADEDLAAVYSGALTFLYASYYEGFGLPALEAMSCGIPVLYGNNSSLPEIVADGGLPADPANVEEIAEKMHLLAMDRAKRDQWARNALRQAGKFSWEQAARETLEVYRRALTARL